MREFGLDLHNLSGIVRHGGRRLQFDVQDGLLAHAWAPGDLATALFTNTERYKLHRSCCHPSVEKLFNMLEHARFEDMDHEGKETLEDIAEECHIYILKIIRPVDDSSWPCVWTKPISPP